MKNLLLNKKYHGLIIALVSVGIPLFISIGNIFVVFLFLISLYVFFYKENKKDIFLNPILFLVLILYIYSLINGLAGYNTKAMLRYLDKNVLSLIIPFSLLVLYKTSYFYKISRYYLIALVSISLVLILRNIYINLINPSSHFLYFHQFTSLIRQHAVYFSLYLALGVLMSIDNLFKANNKKLNIFYIIIFFIGLWFCASKAIMGILLILIPLQIIINKKKVVKAVSLYLLLIISFILLVFNNSYLKNRFISGLDYDLEFTPSSHVEDAYVFSNDDKDDISDIELREIFAKISLFHLYDDGNLIFGYGLSDNQDFLDYYYMIYGLAPNHYEGYNPHNQYIFLLFSMGVIGLILFLIYFLYSFYMGLKHKNKLHLLFLFLMGFAMLFETYLVRNKGIVFFFFFNTIFLINNQKT